MIVDWTNSHGWLLTCFTSYTRLLFDLIGLPFSQNCYFWRNKTFRCQALIKALYASDLRTHSLIKEISNLFGLNSSKTHLIRGTQVPFCLNEAFNCPFRSIIFYSFFFYCGYCWSPDTYTCLKLLSVNDYNISDCKIKRSSKHLPWTLSWNSLSNIFDRA